MLPASPGKRDVSFDEEPCRTTLHMAEFLGGVPRYPKLHPCGLGQSSAASEPPATAADTLHRSATPPSATNADTTNAAIVAVQCQEIRQSPPSSGRVILPRFSVEWLWFCWANLKFETRQGVVLIGSMNNESEIKRLSDAVASITSTITEIIDTRLKLATEMSKDVDGWAGRSLVPRATEGWVGKMEVARHFKISRRTVDNWMSNGSLPYIRIGRNVRFKLSEADEALNRRYGSQGQET
jgi:excisionase family DNA binding protein